jgi:hypothetical protein
MNTEQSRNPESRLIPVLREGICVVQMILFKELRSLLTRKHPDRDSLSIAMLSGAITNELFGTINLEEKFQDFRKQNRADIEQGLLNLAQELPTLTAPLTDALRIQALCDHQEEMDPNETTRILAQAVEIGLLITERELPLPSTFMTMTRSLGDTHQLIIPPAQIYPDDDQGPVQ